jgi:hypothetical protein
MPKRESAYRLSVGANKRAARRLLSNKPKLSAASATHHASGKPSKISSGI